MEFVITITGTAPLLMHNSRLANPLDPAAKALKRVTGKRNKTDDDHEEVARLEHAGSLYIDPDAGPYLPADNIWRALYDAWVPPDWQAPGFKPRAGTRGWAGQWQC